MTTTVLAPTPQEIELAAALARGLTDAEAGLTLYQLRYRLRRLYQRAGWRGALDMVAAGCEVGWLIPTEPAPRPDAVLSVHEELVLRCMAQGLSDKEIGKRPGRSTDTVRTRAKTLYSALGISGESEAPARIRAVALGYQLGLLHPPVKPPPDLPAGGPRTILPPSATDWPPTGRRHEAGSPEGPP